MICLMLKPKLRKYCIVVNGPLSFLVQFDAGMLHYRWPTLVISALIAIAGLRWLVRQTDSESPKIADEAATLLNPSLHEATAVEPQHVSVGS